MNTVFIGGSRQLSRVNAELAERLDNIMEKRLHVIVGDANGFDRAAQAYLASHQYPLVRIYCTLGKCRNNVGSWPIQAIEYSGSDRGRAFFTAKDDAMLNDADYGLFAWDGNSMGTLRNIQKMAEQAKPSVVYVSTLKKSITIRSAQEASALSSNVILAASSEDLFAENLVHAGSSASP